MRRPLLVPTLLWVGGIVLAEGWSLPLTVWFSLAAVALIAAFGDARRRTRWLGVTCVLLGGLAHDLDQATFSPVDLRRISTDAAQLATLRGTIAETPALRLSERRGEFVAHSSVRVEVSAWRPERGLWAPASGSVLLTLRAPLPPPAFRGREVEAYGVLKAPAPPDAPGLFDYATFLRRQRIYRLFLVENTNELHLPASALAPPWSERFLPWAHSVLARGLPDDEAARLLRAMTLGWKTPLTGEVDDVFMRAGTMHVFAISGLHIALLTGMLVQLFRAVRLERLWAGVLAVPVTWAYVAATGWQPSAVRSAVMASVVVGGWVLRRPGDLLNSLAGAAALLLVLDPGELFQSGFQLSFGAVAGLALLVPPLERRLLGWCELDPFIPDELRPRWQLWLGHGVRFLALDLAVGLAAFLVSLPLTVHHFNLISPVSLVANLLVVPLSSLALAATVTSLAVAPLAPELSELFNASGWLWMSGMTGLSRWFAAWPVGWWSVTAPPWFWWVGWYAALALGVRWENARGVTRGSRDRLAWLTPVLAGAVSLWGIAAGLSWVAYRRTPRLFVFRADPGMVLETATGAELIDGGRAGAGHRVVGPFLRAHGYDRLLAHWVTQGVQRFCGVGPELLTNVAPCQVYVPAAPNSRQPVLRRYLEQLKTQRVSVQPLSAGAAFSSWAVLSPSQENASAKANKAADQAMVLRGEFSGVCVLWLGGASRSVVRALLQEPDQLRADLVVVAATAGTDPFPPELLAAIRPQLAIVITAPFPAAAQLSPADRDRLHQLRFPILLTDEAGGVAVEFDAGRLRWKTYGVPGPPRSTRHDPATEFAPSTAIPSDSEAQ